MEAPVYDARRNGRLIGASRISTAQSYQILLFRFQPWAPMLAAHQEE
jgi:hypothetical protein